uniref:Uncharacterized protein n=1 Tax=viral metagenome TaxID=1070528 RepID=A0A6C0ATX6_9ZZZZ
MASVTARKYLRAPKAAAAAPGAAASSAAAGAGSTDAYRTELLRRKIGPGGQSSLPNSALECLPDLQNKRATAIREEAAAKERWEGGGAKRGGPQMNTAAARERLYDDVVDSMRTDTEPHQPGAAVVQVLSAATRVQSNVGPALRILRVMLDRDEDGDAMGAARRHARFIMRSGYTSLPCYVVQLGKAFSTPLSDADALAAVPAPQELPGDDAAYAATVARRDRMREAVRAALRTDRVASHAVAVSYGRDAATVERGYLESTRNQHVEAYTEHCQAHPAPTIAPDNEDDAFTGVPARVPAEPCGLVGVKKLHRDVRQDGAALCGVCVGLDERPVPAEGHADGAPQGSRPWFIVLGGALPDGAAQDDLNAAGAEWQAQVATRMVHITRMYEWIFAWGRDAAPRVDMKSDASRAAAQGIKARKEQSQRSQRLRSMLPDNAMNEGQVVDTGSNNDDPPTALQRAAGGCLQHTGFAAVSYTV